MDTADSSSNLSIQFTGSGEQYLKVLFINVIFTLCTLGLFLPWAIIRSQKYYYAHTQVSRQALVSRASAWHLLAGYLLTSVLVFLLVAGISSLHQDVLRLDAPHVHSHTKQHESHAEGHQEFQWHPDISDGEKDYLENGHKHADPAQVIRAQFEDKSTEVFNLVLLLLLIAILIPVLDYALSYYLITHTQLGEERLSLRSSLLSLLGIYLKFYALALISLLTFVILAFFMAAMISSIFSPESASSSLHNIGLVFWLLVLLAMVTSAWLFACLNKWRWQWRLGGIMAGDRSLSTDYKIGILFKVYCVNAVSALITLGVALPWVLVRSYRMKIAELHCAGS